MVDIKYVDQSVYLLLLEKFKLGLFENPYVDEDAAEKIVGNASFQAKADLAMRKSIVLLRNDRHLLPLKPKTKVYFESYFEKRGATSPTNIYQPKINTSSLEFVSEPAAADVIVCWITPGSKSLFEADGSAIYLSLSKNGVNIDHINQLASGKPTILAINYTNPWVIDEIYNDSTKKNIPGVIATFGTTLDAVIDIISGKFNPSGKMPFSTPSSESAAQNQLPDVPGYKEKKGYALFNMNEGLKY
jgi:beta-glucosidase